MTPRTRTVIAVGWLVATALAGCASMTPSSRATARPPKNIIVLVAEGAGAAQFELARLGNRQLRNEGFAVTDVVLRRGSVGVMTTHARDGLSGDTAATATAMSTGVKTRSGMIAMSPEGERLATALSTAQLAGKRIGLVTTARVSGALPASFSVHATSRRDHDAIVDAYVSLRPDVLLGGGADHFLPVGAGGRRTDARDLIREFDRHGYVVVRTRTELTTARGPRLLGLFAGGDLGHEIDRGATSTPPLVEMTQAALRTLTATPGPGFVLVIGSEAIDSVGHANDVAALLHDLWAFDRAVEVALDFQRRAPSDTLVIVAGSHETGGLAPTLAPPAGGRGVTGFANQAYGATPVVVGALGPGAEAFRGWYDNTDFGRALHRLIRGPGDVPR